MARAFLAFVVAFFLCVLSTPAQDNPAAQVMPGSGSTDNSSAAGAAGNPDLAQNGDDLYATAGQTTSPLDLETRYRLLLKCLVPDGQAHYKYIPAILNALSQDPAIDQRRQSIILACSQFYEYRGTVGVLCGDPQMQQAIHALAEPLTHNENSLVFFEAMGLMARTDDAGLFHRLAIYYKSDRRAADGSVADLGALPHLKVERELLASVLYRGPLEKRLDTIAENADACTFDSSNGRWTLTITGYENQPPVTNGAVPQLFRGHPAAPPRPDPDAIPKL